MNMPTLIANIETGEGSVTRPEYWAAADLMLKADLLQDWIADLQEECKEVTELLFTRKPK